MARVTKKDLEDRLSDREEIISNMTLEIVFLENAIEDITSANKELESTISKITDETSTRASEDLVIIRELSKKTFLNDKGYCYE